MVGTKGGGRTAFNSVKAFSRGWLYKSEGQIGQLEA